MWMRQPQRLHLWCRQAHHRTRDQIRRRAACLSVRRQLPRERARPVSTLRKAWHSSTRRATVAKLSCEILRRDNFYEGSRFARGREGSRRGVGALRWTFDDSGVYKEMTVWLYGGVRPLLRPGSVLAFESIRSW